MPRGQKRAAADDGEGRATRSSKVAKTETANGAKPATKGGKRGPKVNIGAAAFKAKALPLHINITHTPSAAAEGTTEVAQTDPGFLGSSTLVPTSFNTGSYGWKGNKRLTVELENSESGEKEKVQVMLTINATVMGSKSAPDDAPAEGEHAEGEEEAKEEAKEASASVPQEPAPEAKTEDEKPTDEDAMQTDAPEAEAKPAAAEGEAPAEPAAAAQETAA